MTQHQHRLLVAGHRFRLTTGTGPDGRRGRLTVDDRQVAEVRLTPPVLTLALDDLATGLDLTDLGLAHGRLRALCWRPGRVLKVALLVPQPALDGALPGRRRPEVLEFEPPAGTRWHRWWSFQQRHPRLYAARHVLVAVTQVAVTLLGLRVAVQLLPWDLVLLPDLPRIPWPDWRPPRIPWPDLPRIPLPGWQLPGWLLTLLHTRTYWLPILVAVGIGVAESRRRQRRRAENSARTGQDLSAEAADDGGGRPGPAEGAERADGTNRRPAQASGPPDADPGRRDHLHRREGI